MINNDFHFKLNRKLLFKKVIKIILIKICEVSCKKDSLVRMHRMNNFDQP